MGDIGWVLRVILEPHIWTFVPTWWCVKHLISQLLVLVWTYAKIIQYDWSRNSNFWRGKNVLCKQNPVTICISKVFFWILTFVILFQMWPLCSDFMQMTTRDMSSQLAHNSTDQQFTSHYPEQRDLLSSCSCNASAMQFLFLFDIMPDSQCWYQLN